MLTINTPVAINPIIKSKIQDVVSDFEINRHELAIVATSVENKTTFFLPNLSEYLVKVNDVITHPKKKALPNEPIYVSETQIRSSC